MPHLTPNQSVFPYDAVYPAISAVSCSCSVSKSTPHVILTGLPALFQHGQRAWSSGDVHPTHECLRASVVAASSSSRTCLDRNERFCSRPGSVLQNFTCLCNTICYFAWPFARSQRLVFAESLTLPGDALWSVEERLSRQRLSLLMLLFSSQPSLACYLLQAVGVPHDLTCCPEQRFNPDVAVPAVSCSCEMQLGIELTHRVVGRLHCDNAIPEQTV